MKKFFTIIAIGILTAATAYCQPRFGTKQNQDNTARQLTYDTLAPIYHATLTVTPKLFGRFSTYVMPGTLTGALTISITDTYSRFGDLLTCIFTSDGTGRVVTFSTNFVTYGTLTLIASKQATVTFVYDGANYVETSRTIQQ